MSFKKNTAVTGFTFGLVSATDGSAITTGTVTGYYTLDGGTQATITGSATHEGNGQWSINLTAAEMNGDIVGLMFTHASAIPASFTISTVAKLVSELKDETMRGTDGANTVAPDNASIATILADTSELQANQGNWTTATGFATVNPDNAKITAIDALLTELTEDDGEGNNRYTAKALENVTALGGGVIEGEWRWTTDTAATDPTSGRMKINNATLASATALYLSTTTNNGFNAQALLEQYKVGDKILFAKSSDTSNYMDVTVSSLPTDNGGWFTIPFTVNSSAGSFGALNLTRVQFWKAGESAQTIAEAVRTEMDANSTKLASILSDTNELQVNQGNWVTADISGLSTFDHTTDQVTVGTNNDKSGYSITQAFPANFDLFDISAAGLASVDVKKMNGATLLGIGTDADKWRGQ